MSQRNLEQCNEPGPIKDLNIDPIPECNDDGTPSQSRISKHDSSWLEEKIQSKTGYGQSGLCDPAQSGHIINEQGMSPPQRDYVYRYSKSIRGCDEAMKDLFSDIVLIDEQDKVWPVPIIWGTQEKAVAAFLQDNYRKDNLIVVDRIKLPAMSIYASGIQFDQSRYIYHKAIDYLRDHDGRPGFYKQEKRHERDTVFGVTRGLPIIRTYTLAVWTRFEEGMNQIYEQIQLKFSPIAYIRVKGISWEIGVNLDGISNNTDINPGDQAIPVIKYEFTMSVETYISQPIVRKKSVLKTRIDVVDNVDNNEIAVFFLDWMTQ